MLVCHKSPPETAPVNCQAVISSPTESSARANRGSLHNCAPLRLPLTHERYGCPFCYVARHRGLSVRAGAGRALVRGYGLCPNLFDPGTIREAAWPRGRAGEAAAASQGPDACGRRDRRLAHCILAAAVALAALPRPAAFAASEA
jgi:hypothetical protein